MIDKNKALELIPSYSQYNEEAKKYDGSTNRYMYKGFLKGAEYVRDYFFNKLNNNKLKTMNINGHELLRLKLREMGIETSPQVLEVILALADYIDDHDEYNPLQIDAIMLKISNKYIPLDPKPDGVTTVTDAGHTPHKGQDLPPL